MGQRGTRNEAAREAVALALAEGCTDVEAAARCRVARHSVQRWKQEPAFAARVKELRATATQRALEQMQAGAAKAVAFLLDSLDNENHSPELRSQNAQRLLDRAGLGPTSTHKHEGSATPDPAEVEQRARRVLAVIDGKKRRAG